MRPFRGGYLVAACLIGCASGVDSLVRIDPESPGGNCPTGGYVIYTGEDLDDDGVLDAEEVTADGIYVCNGEGEDGLDGLDGEDGLDGQDGTGGGLDLGPVVEGNYTIENSVDAALLAGVETITGDLTILSGVTTLELPDLIEVYGTIYVIDNTTLELVSFPALDFAGGVDIEYAELLVDLDGFATMTTTYYFYVYGNFSLESIDLPTLGILDSLTITDNDLLTTLSLSAVPDAIATDGTYFEISDNDELDMCIADALLADAETAGYVGSSFVDGGIACQ